MGMLRSKLFVFIAIIAVSKCLKLSSIKTPFERGLKAYKGERWSECITQFEDSLQLYKMYKSTIIYCRLKCHSEPFESKIKENYGDLKIYEIFFNRKECLMKCHEKGFKELYLLDDIEETLLHDMQARKPYEYLHMCYFQMNAIPKAASAVYTYLVANPDDEAMNQNLVYYTHQPEVDIKEVVDLQSDDYKILYKLGLEAYNQNNWADTVANMEEVIVDYLSSENNCRVECERQPEQEWSSEFFATMSNNAASLLHCQQQCQDKLKALQYNSGVEFLADVLNYIQICYYRLNRIDDAAKSVATYLMLLPNDEDMLENKNIYSTLTVPKSFTERSDIEYYLKRDKYEKELLNFFHTGSSKSIDSNSV